MRRTRNLFLGACLAAFALTAAGTAGAYHTHFICYNMLV